MDISDQHHRDAYAMREEVLDADKKAKAAK